MPENPHLHSADTRLGMTSERRDCDVQVKAHLTPTYGHGILKGNTYYQTFVNTWPGQSDGGTFIPSRDSLLIHLKLLELQKVNLVLRGIKAKTQNSGITTMQLRI